MLRVFLGCTRFTSAQCSTELQFSNCLASLPASRQMVRYSICSRGRPMVQLVEVLFILRITNTLSHLQGLPGSLQVGTRHVDPMDSLPKLWSAERLTQGFERSAGKEGEPAASPAPRSVGMTLSFSELPAAFLLLASSPHLADRAAVWLHIAPPKVDAPGPHIPLSDLFPGLRCFLPKQSPTSNVQIQLKPLLPVLLCIIFPKH